MNKIKFAVAGMSLAVVLMMSACGSRQDESETIIETDTLYPDGTEQTTSEVDIMERHDEPTLGQKVDTAVADVKHATHEAKEDIKDAARSVKEDAKDMAKDVKEEAKKGAEKVSNKAEKIKEDLKKDTQ